MLMSLNLWCRQRVKHCFNIEQGQKHVADPVGWKRNRAARLRSRSRNQDPGGFVDVQNVARRIDDEPEALLAMFDADQQVADRQRRSVQAQISRQMDRGEDLAADIDQAGDFRRRQGTGVITLVRKTVRTFSMGMPNQLPATSIENTWRVLGASLRGGGFIADVAVLVEAAACVMQRHPCPYGIRFRTG